MTSVGDVVEEGVEVDEPSGVAARRKWREGILMIFNAAKVTTVNLEFFVVKYFRSR